MAAEGLGGGLRRPDDDENLEEVARNDHREGR